MHLLRSTGYKGHVKTGPVVAFGQLAESRLLMKHGVTMCNLYHFVPGIHVKGGKWATLCHAGDAVVNLLHWHMGDPDSCLQ